MEEQKNLISYRKVVDVVRFTINPTDEEYCEVLTCLFNNKRDEKDILEIYNYYGSNKISIVVNLTDYAESNYYDDEQEAKEDAIAHMKRWINNFMKDNDENNIEVYENKACIYYIDEYSSNLIREIDGEYLTNYYIGE